MALARKRFVATLGCLLLTACASGPGAPGVSFTNTDRSEGRRAESSCRAEAGTGGAGAMAAYEACMARYRRPPDDE